MIKVISFSIYGDKPMYTVGLLKNLELAKNIYPDWTVYIYYNNTVPVDMIEKYKDFDNCELFDMNNYNIPGMFWRFLPHENVERFISRDADSRLSIREKLAVNEWIESDKYLHTMRDHPHHSVKIFGGMFGLKIDNNYKIDEEINKWIIDKDKSLFNRYGDVNFLNDIVYEKYFKMKDILTHDSVFTHFLYSKPFPIPLQDYRFVGEIYDENDKRFYQYTEWINKKEIR